MLIAYLFSNDYIHIESIYKAVTVFLLLTSSFALYDIAHLVLNNISVQRNIGLIVSTMGHKNLLSSILFMGAIFLFDSVQLQKKWWRYITIFTLILCFGLIVLLQTRAVWIGIIVSLLIFYIGKYCCKRKSIY